MYILIICHKSYNYAELSNNGNSPECFNLLKYLFRVGGWTVVLFGKGNLIIFNKRKHDISYSCIISVCANMPLSSKQISHKIS